MADNTENNGSTDVTVGAEPAAGQGPAIGQEPGGEEKGGTGEAKAKKQPAVPKNRALEIKKAKKKKRKRRILIIVLVAVLIILVAGFVFEEMYFNYLGIRDKFIDAVVQLDPAYGARQKNLDSREAELNKRQAELDTREADITKRETENDKRTVDLDNREKTLKELEALPTATYRPKLTDQEIAKMKSLSLVFAKMDPTSAAAILVSLVQPDDCAEIIYYMSERSAAPILAAMDPKFAATVTELLLYR